MSEDFQRDKQVILQAMERYQVEKTYVSALGGYVPNPEEVEGLNRAVAEFVREQPGRIGGYVYVSPEHANAQDVVRRGVEDAGMEGVKLWVSALCDDPCVNPVMEQAIGYGVPVLIHSFYKAYGQLPHESIGWNVANIARRYPEAKIIMAHLGGNCYDGIPAIRDCPNVWCDFSGSLFRGDELDYAVSFLGAERLLFGTDMPHFFLDSFGQVLEADLTEYQRELIFWRNAAKIFDTQVKLRMAEVSA